MTAWFTIAVALYLAVVAALYFLQDGLLFPRNLTHRGHLPLPPGAARHELVTEGGHRLVGHVLARPDAKAVVLLFTGNAWNAEDCLIFSAQRLRDVHLVAFHYRGYAPSEGLPSEAAFLEDALAQRDLARRLFGQQGAGLPMVAIGYSIGTGIAARLAGDGAVDGAVLVTPFDSVEAVARGRYFFAPVALLLKNKFRSDRALAGRDVPVAVITAANDQVIPKRHSDALVDVLARPVLVETVDGAGHASLYDLPLFDALLARALDRVVAAAEVAGERSLTAPVRDRLVQGLASDAGG